MINNFLAKFNIEIKNKRLYEEALTHTSYSNEFSLKYNYQRLEFLGDSILSFLVSNFLMRKYCKEKEGFLTKMRSMIVRENSLAYAARKIELGKLIRFGQGEIFDKGYDKDSILADVFESFLSAIYLDNDIYTAEKYLEQVLLNDEVIIVLENLNRNFKSELQEAIQAENRSDLIYVSEQISKDSEQIKIFEASVSVDGVVYGKGTGTTKKDAEQMAAKSALDKLYTN